ncbi:kinase-like protein [Athelia psychrophila]|uniref:non-specific serine/threonine protein kinase n=1 Tax=Athelia psychrophila TaxID=1759441 RepID=A0A166LYD6_9AGAM|nr:kinase-like protein [Fibularhizoctonia sp. CBS 109695]
MMPSPLGSQLSLTAPDETTPMSSSEPVASSSTSGAVLALSRPSTGRPAGWHPILHASNQVVLYNPTSHALDIRHRHTRDVYPYPRPEIDSPRPPQCPYCSQPLPPDFDFGIDLDAADEEFPERTARDPEYFQLLAIANETSSRPSSPGPSPALTGGETGEGEGAGAFRADAMAEGYFKAFFVEECKLGMGANGSVFLCQHKLDGNALGHFAIKKIAVGESHAYLLQTLREVRLLERLHHPNIITYHHAWLESCRFSAFGPPVPTLHVLMQWAEGGSLDDFIDLRLGRATHLPRPPPPPRHPHTRSHSRSSSRSRSRSRSPTPTRPKPTDDEDPNSRSARIRAFRAAKAAPGAAKRAEPESRRSGRMTAVHLLSAEEVRALFGDVAEGLGFLHAKAILHLDLKPGNVLLTWDEDQDKRLIPRAMLSDFGTSRDMLHTTRARSGNTGTLEYTAPETLPAPHTGRLQPTDSKADLWSLGMILHKLLFFRLPYRYAAAGDENGEASAHAQDLEEGEKMERLEREIQTYPGFKTTPALVAAFEARRLPRAYLVLLESLLSVNPAARPTCERVLSAIREGRLDPVQPTTNSNNAGTLISVPRRPAPESKSDSPPRSPAAPWSRSSSESKGGTPASPLLEQIEHFEHTPRVQRLLMGDAGVSVDRAGTVTLSAGPVGRFLVPRGVWVRTCKAAVLVGKMLSMGSICANSTPRPIAVLVLAVAAALDTCIDELWVCAALGVFHVLFLRFGCAAGACCLDM